MKYIIQADDFGLTKGITDNILECFDQGALNSTSIFANGHAFDYAIKEYRKRPELRLGIHLNLVEGKPILDSSKVSLLVNKEGEFCYSFVDLWRRYLLGNSQVKRDFKLQVKNELAAQINKVRQALGETFSLNIDSHLHYHMIPFVFDTLLELNKDYHFEYIRLPEEPVFFLNERISNYSINLFKNLLLNSLSRQYRNKYPYLQQHSCQYFIGVLYTGNMTTSSAQKAFERIDFNKKALGMIEILFHPGGASFEEADFWRNRKELHSYYFSPWRDKEKEVLKDASFRAWIERLSLNHENLSYH
ncbi:MAG: ChbG/HpnK family deacetylase [Candidatus Omnitrophica bacterium]|nr:ChbG/HpnK family deacetylase [Candidatus Omnitrophota bacterium]